MLADKIAHQRPHPLGSMFFDMQRRVFVFVLGEEVVLVKNLTAFGRLRAVFREEVPAEDRRFECSLGSVEVGPPRVPFIGEPAGPAVIPDHLKIFVIEDHRLGIGDILNPLGKDVAAADGGDPLRPAQP